MNEPNIDRLIKVTPRGWTIVETTDGVSQVFFVSPPRRISIEYATQVQRRAESALEGLATVVVSSMCE
jgi:hypothetical protein